MNNPLGVMQGRLLPKYQGRYQAHPVGFWEDEFSKAAELGLDCIEFILDFNDADQNPLLSPKGRTRIQVVSARTGVKVLSVCADYFMEAPFYSENDQVVERSSTMLKRLLEAAGELGVGDIIIPCVDHSSIRDEKKRARFRENFSELLPEAERCGVNLSLETDLNPSQLGELLAQLDSRRVTVNYDIGNSASLGYDPVEELSVYGKRISDVHIKDRVFLGGTVKLGTGNADIPGFFRLLERFDYRGLLVMQAFRDDEGVAVFKEQLDWVKPHIGRGA